MTFELTKFNDQIRITAPGINFQDLKDFGPCIFGNTDPTPSIALVVETSDKALISRDHIKFTSAHPETGDACLYVEFNNRPDADFTGILKDLWTKLPQAVANEMVTERINAAKSSFTTFAQAVKSC